MIFLLTLILLFLGCIFWIVLSWFEERKRARAQLEELQKTEKRFLKQKLDELNLERKVGLR